MTNHDLGVTNGPVELGAPTLTINPSPKLEEQASVASPKEVESKDDVAANPDKP